MKNSKRWVGMDGDQFCQMACGLDRRLKDIYAISLDDAGIDDEFLKPHWEEKEAPFEFVLWFGNKYDLDPSGVFGHFIK